MLEAFAAGDQVTLRQICTKQFATQLGAAIARRSPREQTTFELVEYKRPMFYPRLKSHMIIPGFLTAEKDLVLEQAVVAIASLQKASKQSTATGKTINGSVKIQDKIEYVVLTRFGSNATYQTQPWRLWGTTSPTTMAAWNQYLSVQDKEQEFRSGYKRKTSP
jgi:protein MBA1